MYIEFRLKTKRHNSIFVLFELKTLVFSPIAAPVRRKFNQPTLPCTSWDVFYLPYELSLNVLLSILWDLRYIVQFYLVPSGYFPRCYYL